MGSTPATAGGHVKRRLDLATDVPSRAAIRASSFGAGRVRGILRLFFACSCTTVGWASCLFAGAPRTIKPKANQPRCFVSVIPTRMASKLEDLVALRKILRGAVEDKTVPGVSLLLAHRGEIIFKEAFGNLTVDQRVMMASSSKPVTATVVMILADQKKLSLDDPIEKYLPEFTGITIKGKPPKNLPTVRHLLCNMSGLPGDFLSESILRRVQEWRGKGPEQGR